MKKIYFYLLPILLSCALRHTANAQCTTNAGTLQSWQAAVCGEADFSFIFNNDAVLDGDDVRLLVAYVGPDPVNGIVLGYTSTNPLPYNPLFSVNSPIQVAPVAGNSNGSGGVDWADPCLSIGPSKTVQYRPLPEVQVFPPGGLLTCDNNVVNLFAVSQTPGVTFAFTGPNGFFLPSPNAAAFAPGLWCAIVTDPFGCQAQSCVPITSDINSPVITLGTPDVISCTNPTATLQGSVVSPPTGYGVHWQGPGGFVSTELNPEVNVPGLYVLSVMDSTNGCYASVTQQVTSDIALGLVAGPVSCGQDTLFVGVVPPASFQLPLTYSWTGGSTTEVFPVTTQPLTDFCVTVTDATNCESILCISPAEVVFPAPMVVEIVPEVINCADQLWYASVSGGSPPYLYLWSIDGVPQPQLTGSGVNVLETGLYSVTIIDAFGCSVTASTVIQVLPDQCVDLHGKVFRDNNEDCSYAAAEPGLGGWIVAASDGTSTYYGTTDNDGNYVIISFPGTYTLSLVTPDPDVWMPCFASVNTGPLGPGGTATVDFPVKPLVDCPIMDVSISTAVLRRCFDNNYYYATWCNNGTVTATDAYLDVALDSYEEIISASMPYTDQGNNVYRFQLGDVPPGQCGTMNVRVKISCDAVIGQVHCTEAHIYPDTACVADPNWSGANVEITGTCDQDSVHFAIKNTGLAPMTVPLEYVVIEDAIMFQASPAPPLMPNEEVLASFPANGATWRIVANQEPNHPFSPATPTAWVEGCVTGNNSFSTGYVQMFPDGDGVPWLDIDCTANIGSYDPNDKQGAPVGYGPAHYVKPGTPLEYLIRFQNTGTDTAFTVTVRDTLSAWLDATSVQPGASSHPYRFELYGDGILQFTFDNILLPDSNINEAASHGFVKFGINPRADVPLETDIFNKAGIYFDFNEPVVTNTTWHRIGENFTLVGWRPERPDLELRIAPQPMGDAARISIDGLAPGVALTVRLLDLNGRVIRTESAVSPNFMLHREGLDSGLYLLEISDAGQIIGHAKLMVHW